MIPITHHAKLILSNAVILVRNHISIFLQYVFALYIPVLVYSIIVSVTGNPFWLVLTLSVILALIQIWIGLALTKEIAERYQHAPTQDLPTQLRATKHIILPSIIISALTTLIVLGGTLLLIIPGIIFSVWYIFGNIALVIDDKRALIALKASHALVKGRWWQVFFAAVLPTVAIIFVLILIDIFLQFVFGIFDLTLLTELLSSFISYLVTPLFTAIFTILYIELKRSLEIDTAESTH
jgi:hypothetical protein